MQSDPYNALNNSGYQYGMKGGADLQCIYRGLHVDIECKKGAGGILSAEQQQRKYEVERNGGVFLVVHGIEELEHLWKTEILVRFGND